MPTKPPEPPVPLPPMAMAPGDVAFLTVTGSAGPDALVDAGVGQTLVVPKREQTWEVEIGARYVFGVIEDERGGLYATMRVAELLHGVGAFRAGDWVSGEAWHEESGIGLFVILGRRHVGLLPADEPHRLTEGDAAEFRIAKVLPDGKPVLSQRGLAHEEISHDADRVLSILRRGRALNVSDRASPEEIRALFGLSKKAFKRAVGHLLKRGDIAIEGDRIVLRGAPSPA